MSTPSRSVVLRTALTTVLLVGVAAGLALSGEARQRAAFPHARHEGLFPVCAGCHAGIPDGDSASFFPSPELCARCHDGNQQRKVTWSGPLARPSNVRFRHPRHGELLQQAGDDPVTCESCHSEAGKGRMAVDTRVELGACFSCHAHRATDHLTDATCATCHEPLARSGFAQSRIEALPVPADHESSDFVLGAHGPEARASSDRCATCHTVERCVACHVDDQLSAIQAIPAAPADTHLPDFVAHYPKPASHIAESWFLGHGRQASADECNTCHTRDDCAACHVQPLPALVEALPARNRTKAPGVMLSPRPPESHASPFFLETHPALASADDRSCNTCHEQAFCAECHDAASGSGNVYHPPNFVARHAARAFGRSEDCATCHNTAVFCRSCHQQSGLGAEGRLGPGFHTAEPLWLLRHGQAARQDLESCASCHQQKECTQCHGVLGAFKISPHGRDFDAESAWKRNPRTCFACHIGNPLEGGGS